MKLKEFRAALQERPWLLKSISQVTGTHPYHVAKRGENWEKHLETWSVRNISEITERAFGELDLDKKAEFIRHQFGPEEKITFSTGYNWRRHEAFTHTEFHIFTRKTYQADNSPDCRQPYSECWVASATHFEGKIPSIRDGIHCLQKPHHSGPISNFTVEIPHVFDAVVCITKIGVVGRCSSAIIDIFPFPANLNPSA